MADSTFIFDKDSQTRVAKATVGFENQFRDTRGVPVKRTVAPPAGLPQPQYQYQVLMGVSMHQLGFAFVSAHPMTSGTE
jgi:hypothetical protein